MLVPVLGLCDMLVVPDLEIVRGFVPQVGAVSLEQYRAAGVPVVSFVVWLHCWIYASLGVLLMLVSIEFETVYPWFLAFLWHAVQFGHVFGKTFVRFC